MMRGWGRDAAGAVVGAMLAMLVLPDTFAHAAEPSMTAQRQALARAREQAEEARQRGLMLERRARTAAAEADRARDRMAAVAARIQQAEGELRAAQVRVGIVAALQRRQARSLAARRQPIARLAAGLQTMARRPPLLALLKPGSMREAVHMRILLGQAVPVIARRTAGLRAELARSRALRADAELARGALLRSRDELARRRSELAELEARKRIDSRQYRDSAALEQDRALAIGEEARDIVDLMDRMGSEGQVRDALAALPGPTLRPARPGVGGGALPVAEAVLASTATPGYRLPVVGDVVTGFGEVADSGLRSRGLTIATEPAATVVAPAAGRVVFAAPFRDYGQIVIIDHGAGWTSLVTRMRRLSVAVGDTVRQGDPIGVAGPVDPRITVELRREDRPIDITALIR